MALTSKRPSKGDETRARLLRDIADTAGKKRRLNADVEDTLYRQIKVRAAEEGRTISDITRALWIDYLSK